VRCDGWLQLCQCLIADTHETADEGDGRIDVRFHAVTHAVDWFFPAPHLCDHPLLPLLRHFQSARVSDAAFAKAVRARRASGNSVPRVLAVTFDEGGARNRKDRGPVGRAIIRKPTLNNLKTSGRKTTIRQERKRPGWSDAFAGSVIGQMR